MSDNQVPTGSNQPFMRKDRLSRSPTPTPRATPTPTPGDFMFPSDMKNKGILKKDEKKEEKKEEMLKSKRKEMDKEREKETGKAK